jgi:hypothetical protein
MQLRSVASLHQRLSAKLPDHQQAHRHPSKKFGENQACAAPAGVLLVIACEMREN